MPICTTCTHPIPYLYTVYESAYNLRLEQCTTCHSFADPYVEHDSLVLALDLILLKRGVYRHLLYNRGAEPRMAGTGDADAADAHKSSTAVNAKEKERLRELHRQWLILRLGGAVAAVDAFIRWGYLNPDRPQDLSIWIAEMTEPFIRVLVGCFAETVAFHCGVILACAVVLNLLDWVQGWTKFSSQVKPSGIRQEFRYSLIPLAIFYSSLTKLFLLFLLSIWRSTPSLASDQQANPWNGTLHENVFVSSALGILDEDKIDREWIVRNVLGGMAAGFGLRVILDCHPIFTTVIILAGWVVKTAVASLISGWVGRDERAGEAWLAYSIP